MNHSPDSPLNIAVIGAGISGICSAYLLQTKHRVTLFDKNNYLGGHTRTVMIPDGPDQGTPVDTGFIVLNQRTYPNFITFLDQLNVRIQPTDMSFGYFCKQTGLYYASSSLNTLFARRINLLKPGYWRFVYEMVRFLKTLQRNYRANRLEDITLGDFIRQNGFHQPVARQFILPMASAIWSGSDISIHEFPVRTFAQFYENHGLLDLSNHPPWYFVEGGSHTYVRAFLDHFDGTVVTDARIRGVKREDNKISLSFETGRHETFDAVVIATHADQALALLADPTPDEQRLLGAWCYSSNEIWLHTDSSIMPPVKRAWASWNYTRYANADDNAPVMVTYDMNRLQNLQTVQQYFVTLNPRQPIKPEQVICKIDYSHPQYSFDAFKTQGELSQISGEQNTYYCGSYFGYGFHEDGVNAALLVAKKFGIRL